MAGRAQPSQPRIGLRERKKIKTRTAIRDATYRLIMDQGYDATTVEQIAEAAEVSPSTVFRYFPAKEDIVIIDEFDPILERELRARPSDESLVDSLRYVIEHSLHLALAAEDPEVSLLRVRLQAEVPAVRSRMVESMSVTGRMICRVLADRTGRDAASLEVRIYAMSLVGALMEAMRYWAEHDHEDDLHDVVMRALDAVQNGL
ncbi:TetR/AcrR family transcriptional regulator [Streptomyces beihaiensis]|uniref:TetR family transcriptional regulator n=1 Tax=Streptomyces beihaiensis TaxID=2984495 RepID=A0ABT3TZC6_9ACTN|nr:TetR family transcriptional regulator [Streptomyces beihaiensis]MCX3062402.1 TetR family transcriptional regulator [Streptomyces beihaiensis]